MRKMLGADEDVYSYVAEVIGQDDDVFYVLAFSENELITFVRDSNEMQEHLNTQKHSAAILLSKIDLLNLIGNCLEIVHNDERRRDVEMADTVH